MIYMKPHQVLWKNTLHHHWQKNVLCVIKWICYCILLHLKIRMRCLPYICEYKSSFFAGETIHILAYQLIFESFIIFMFSASIRASANISIFYINKAVSVAISLSFRSRLFQPIYFLPCPKRINSDLLPFNMLPLIASGFGWSFNYIV